MHRAVINEAKYSDHANPSVPQTSHNAALDSDNPLLDIATIAATHMAPDINLIPIDTVEAAAWQPVITHNVELIPHCRGTVSHMQRWSHVPTMGQHTGIAAPRATCVT